MENPPKATPPVTIPDKIENKFWMTEEASQRYTIAQDIKPTHITLHGIRISLTDGSVELPFGMPSEVAAQRFWLELMRLAGIHAKEGRS